MSFPSMAQFASLLGERFEVSSPSGGVADTLTLIELENARHAPLGYEAFLLVFHGAPSTLLPAGMMRICHPAFGETEVYMAPFARDAEVSKYQVIFN